MVDFYLAQRLNKFEFWQQYLYIVFMIIKNFTAMLQSVKDFKFKDIITLIIVCFIALFAFYVYTEIKNTKELISTEIISGREKFFMEFSLEAIETERVIRDTITEMRIVVNASQASL